MALCENWKNYNVNASMNIKFVETDLGSIASDRESAAAIFADLVLPRVVNVSSLGIKYTKQTFDDPHLNSISPRNIDSGMYNHMKPEALRDMAQKITRSPENANDALTKTSERGCATGIAAALALDLPD
ncbi:hypothetical protein FocTR4_00015884 [Fusarium oxysporum f. sp. cubense]|uniref:Uncharacterized protein n=1 Tax=Fusarium oxysporum f. sp. cubense TaxID=61366 RepID=A0A5C6SBV9_FUSOC|nr:hypothetical protein FocTR4_00015884 [Fusarium oxysporum f. sp. cubense]